MFLRGCVFSDIIIQKWIICFLIIELGNKRSQDSPTKDTAVNAH